MLKTAVFSGSARIQMALGLVGVGVAHTPLGASLVGPEGLLAVVMVAVVSAATLGRGHAGVTVQDEPWVTLAGLHTGPGAGS